jgi:hypothetical protein
MNTRRLVCVLLGGWLGAGIFMAVLAAYQFMVVDQVLTHPNSAGAQAILRKLPVEEVRLAMRHQAAESNRAFMDGWGAVQIILGIVVFGLLLFGTSMGKLPLVIAALVTLLTAGNHLLVTPSVVGLERAVEFRAEFDSQSLRSQLRGFQGSYRAIEGVKAVGLLLLAGVVILHKPPRRRRGSSTGSPEE